MKLTLFWRTVAARILIALVGVSFVSIAISVISLSWQARSALIENIEARNLEIARQASREISRYVLESIDELGSFGTILGPLPYEPWIRQTMLANLALEYRKFHWMAILDPDGKIEVDGRLDADRAQPLKPEVTAAVLANRRIVSPVEIGADYTPFMVVSVPVRSTRGARGWLIAELYLRNIWDLVDAVTIGGKHVAYLVSSTGKLIAHPDKVRVLKPESYAPLPVPPSGLPPERNWRIEKEGVDTYLTAYAKVDGEGIDWDVAVQQPLRDAFLPASSLFRWSVLLGCVGFIISVVLGLLLSRAISAPLVHLLEGTRIIGAGDLAYRIKPLGGDELKKLADSFNGMVESLQQRTLQLGESERQYRLMTERVNDVIFTLDEQGTITFVSPRLKELTGHAPTQAVGRGILDLLPEAEREKYRPVLRDLLESDDRVNREVQVELKSADGRKMIMEAHITGENGPDGKRRVYGVARDVSERARLLDQLNQAQKMEAVGRLAGGVAHDFNNLLTAIIGYCDYSLLDPADLDTVRKNLEEIKKAGGRAAALTQQLLAFSRRQAMQPRIVDLNRLIVNLERLLHRLLGEDIALEPRLSPVTLNLLADPGQIEQVVMNLCINARDAMPRGGRITVETDRVIMDSTRHGLKDIVMRGDFVRLRITDTGTGMDAETKSHLFEPFFTTKDVGKGTGLGLSTVYGIVKQTNGYIWVESEPGRGTSFEILFPHAEPHQAEVPGTNAENTPAGADPPGPRADSPRGAGETVLLVEDETVIRSLVRNVLSSNGYAVLEAEDGERALDLFRARSADINLVITDVVLPGAGGRDIVERMHADRPGVPALFMSGYTRDVIDNHGALSPGLAFLQKPFSPDALLRKVREVLGAPRPL